MRVVHCDGLASIQSGMAGKLTPIAEIQVWDNGDLIINTFLTSRPIHVRLERQIAQQLAEAVLAILAETAK